jgi:hypothetical protein
MAGRDSELIEQWLAEVAHLTSEIARIAGILKSMPKDAPESERSARLAELSGAMRTCSEATKRIAASLGLTINLQ